MAEDETRGCRGVKLKWMVEVDDVNADRLARLLAPVLNVAARLTRRNWFWYRDISTGHRHLYFGR